MAENREYDPHKLHLKKGKYYVSVAVPKQVRHLFSEARVRRSTGVSDRRVAERVAVQKLPEIHRDLDVAFDRLDPFVEGLRHILEVEGVDVGQWYSEGKLTLTVRGERTLSYKSSGIKIQMEDGKALTLVEKWEVTNYPDLCAMVSGGLGYTIPRGLVSVLSDQDISAIEEMTLPRIISPLDTGNIIKKTPKLFEDRELGDHLLRSMGKPVTRVKLESVEGRMPLFSEWSQQYISDKLAKDSADVHGKRKKACAAFLEVCGDKRLSEYDKVHAIELARYLDNDKNGKQWAKATIKNYYSYVRQAFAYAGEVRDTSSGKIILANHPFHEVKLSEYGFEGKPYLPFTTEELHDLFRHQMGKQERLLLTILISTGMRLDEVALMTWERLTSYDSVWCFSLVATGDEEVTVKNKGSMRYIPVPDVVKPLLGKASKGRVFNYRIDKEGKAQAKASDAVMTIIRKVTDNDRKVGHSLRGNFKDLVRNLQVSKETNDFLTGHAQGDVAGDRYGKGPSMDERLKVINSIKHPWLGKKVN